VRPTLKIDDAIRSFITPRDSLSHLLTSDLLKNTLTASPTRPSVDFADSFDRRHTILADEDGVPRRTTAADMDACLAAFVQLRTSLSANTPAPTVTPRSNWARECMDMQMIQLAK
jgi:hypothetical protein